jgi:zinc and cadmium transporter
MSVMITLLVSGCLMAVIALSGSLALLLPPRIVDKLLLPLVALAAGTLMGGALFHLFPASLMAGLTSMETGIGLTVGFTLFLVLEHGLHWHHCHRAAVPCRRPLTYLILLGDGLHNFLGGLAVGASFITDVRVGWTAWLAAAFHEVPQELGDFGVLLHGGWPRGRALAFNFISGLTFLVGMLCAYVVSAGMRVEWLLPVAAGNFVYIAAADLVPELTRHAAHGRDLQPLVAFALGLGFMYLLAGQAL